MNARIESKERPQISFHPRSLRDPAGQVFEIDQRIIRVVHRAGLPLLDAALGSLSVRRFIADGKVVVTRKLDFDQQTSLLREFRREVPFPASEVGCVLEHEKVDFISYPFEWAPEMLHRAGQLTLDLARSLHHETLGIKDATPYNVLFAGPRPVFVDFMSFEKRHPLDPIWRANAQFASSFLTPLLVNKYFGIPLNTLLFNRRDGVPPEEVYSLCSWVRRWMPPFLGLVTLPALLTSRRRPIDPKVYRSHLATDAEKAAFILDSLYRRNERALNALTPPERSSFWTGYMDNGFPHSPEQLKQKEAFLVRALREQAPKRLLDIGCNTGHFSRIAAGSGAMVVAIDSDPVAVGRAWKTAAAEQLDVLPLVVNFASPSPAVGWNNGECQSFLERGHLFFDMVLMFAIVHHLLEDGIPLRQILSVASQLTRDVLTIEFVGPKDPAFERMARGRDFNYLTEAYFEAQFEPLFQMIRKEKVVDGERFLYLLRRTEPYAPA